MIRKEIDFKNSDEVLEFIKHFSFDEILNYSEYLRMKYFSNKIEFCSIYNVKSGRCSENCAFCSQSSFHKTEVDEYEIGDDGKILQLAKDMADKKVKYFSLVSSGRSLNEMEFSKVIDIFRNIKSDTDISLCASLGFLTAKQAEDLKNVGVVKYHHNLETGPGYFSKICSTHSYEDKLNTINIAKNSGLEVCSGGIFGIGETLNDRIEMALDIKRLKIKSIPLNILKPIKGTRLDKNTPLSEEEIMLSFALFRIINPSASIRIAGGRPFFKENENEKLLKCGVNAIMVGNYLTTTGVQIEKDISFIKENNLTLS